MPLEFEDTIAALASAPGPAERGIIRLSGDAVVQSLAGHFTPLVEPTLKPARRAQRYPGVFHLNAIDQQLPTSLLLWPTKRSYTGQPMAELHTIGSPPLLEAMLAQLYDAGVRPAQNGEFTLRAFLSGRIDLVQAEAVLGVIDSTDQQQMQRALKQLGGGVSGKLATTRAELIAILGDLEAGLDFVEEDIEFIPQDVMIKRLNVAIERLQQLASSADSRMESTNTIAVTLAGLPNAGKSTMFNALAESDVALVSEVAGTTRDYLTIDIDCDGLAVRLIDTAGQETTASPIMQIAQQHRSEQLQESQLIVWCSAADLTPAEQAQNLALRTQLANDGHFVLHIRTKSDLRKDDIPDGSVHVCAFTGEGLPRLRTTIATLLRTHSPEGELIGSTGARCYQLLGSAITSLSNARDAATGRLGDELVAIELRAALESIGLVLGTVYTDDILDHIFSNFCIGK
jgi:tRNA modification GTPase